MRVYSTFALAAVILIAGCTDKQKIADLVKVNQKLEAQYSALQAQQVVNEADLKKSATRQEELDKRIAELQKENEALTRSLKAAEATISDGVKKEATTPPAPMPQTPQATTPAGAPEWVAKGAGLYEGEYGWACYWVGVAKTAPSENIQKSQARTRARVAASSTLAPDMVGRMKKLIGLAQQAFTIDQPACGALGQDMAQNATNNALVSVEQVAIWKADNGDLYVLMKLPVTSVEEIFKEAVKREMDTDAARKAFGLNTPADVERMQGLVEQASKTAVPAAGAEPGQV